MTSTVMTYMDLCANSCMSGGGLRSVLSRLDLLDPGPDDHSASEGASHSCSHKEAES